MYIFTSILVFIAVAFIGYFTIITIYKFVLERQEQNKNEKYDNLKRYIEPKKLLRIRVMSASIVFSAFFSILVFLGVLNWIALIIVPTTLSTLSYMLPYWYFLWKDMSRKEQFQASLLDFVMGLSSGMKAGQSLPQALTAVGKRLTGPITEEIAICIREQRLGLDITEALDRLHERMPFEDLHLLVTSIKLTTKSGGSLVEVLEKLVDTIRQRTEFQEKLKTMTAQGRFEAVAISLAPVAAFILLYIVDRDLMAPMLVTPIGWTAMGIVVVLVSSGFYVINKIVTIDI